MNPAVDSEEYDIWDHIVRAVCLICGRFCWIHEPDEVPLCDRCGAESEGEE